MRVFERGFVAVFVVAAVSLLGFGSAVPAGAQSANPWTLGIVDASFIWAPPAAVLESIPKCAYELAKQTGYNPNKESRHKESPLQHCLVQAMHEHGASENAIAFAKWYFDTPYGDSVYITALAKPQFGPVQLASIYYPGRANNNSAYLFVNGTNPRVADPMVVFAPAGQSWKHDATYKTIAAAHPNATVFPTLTFVSVAKRTGGGQRFTLSAPIVDGCHACAVLGKVDIAYDFGNLGAPKGAFVASVTAATP